MKRLLTIAAVCLLGTGGFAQSSSVVVTPITANYTAAPPTVTFKVSWPGNTRDADHHSKVWVLVDYLRIKNNEYAGSWSRADITVPESAITTTAGTVSLETGNTKGFWLQGWAGASPFAATVTVPVTVDLNGFDKLFGWCGVASDRPPYAEEMSGYYALNGQKPFIIQTHPTNTGSAVSENSTTYQDCIYGLTDATNSPDSKWPPMPAITGFTTSATTICAGQSATLTAVATNAQSYSFDDGANWQAATAKVVSPATTTTYKLKATRIKGACTVTWPTEITITVYPTPDIEFVNPPAVLCAGSEATLTVNDKNSAASSYCFTYECTDCVHNGYLTGNDEAAAVACYWYSECVYSGANTYTLTIPDAGTFTVWAKAITAYGCVSATGLPVTATVHTAVGQATISGAASNTCPASTVSLTASATGATSFTWYKDGVQVQTGTSSVYTVTSSGSYTVQGIDANCIGTTSPSHVVTIDSCNDVPGCAGLKLYQIAAAIDGTGPWSTAYTYCDSRGARLPTLEELVCMCENKSEIPGGYTTSELYWSSTVSGFATDFYYIWSFNSCGYSYSIVSNSTHFRCVL